MAKTIAIIGSTGGQGGSVARRLLKNKGWNVRGITRNVEGKAAKALVAEGAQVVAANVDDEESLVKAFEGVHAVFAVTNFWEQLGRKNAKEASEYESGQAIKIASAAAKTKTLEHYVWSTLPATAQISKGKHFVPHMEPKAQIDQYIRDNFPDLAKKTTFLWVSWYAANMAYVPSIKPTELPMSGKYVWLQPSRGSALLPSAGDISVNIGVFVEGILAHPEVSLPGRYAWVKTESFTFEEILHVWSRVTGKEAEYVDVPFATYVKLWGPAGEEMATQYKFGEDHGDWADFKRDLLTPEQLGIRGDQLVGIEEYLGKMKAALL